MSCRLQFNSVPGMGYTPDCEPAPILRPTADGHIMIPVTETGPVIVVVWAPCATCVHGRRQVYLEPDGRNVFSANLLPEAEVAKFPGVLRFWYVSQNDMQFAVGQYSADISSRAGIRTVPFEIDRAYTLPSLTVSP